MANRSPPDGVEMSVMGGIGPQLALVALLVLLNAGFAGSELGLVSLREGQLQRLEKASATGATPARRAREPNRFLATIQVGITLAGSSRRRPRPFRSLSR
jgi:putative hemolysin